ncbi:MAG: OmpA family protein [Oscillospiraceae bacterium]|nr:OmpA family protein [Oscillospiraceae bacterium]
MKTLRILAAVLASSFLVTAAGCDTTNLESMANTWVIGEQPQAATTPVEEETTEPVEETMVISAETADVYAENPSAVYSATSYRPEMFYGKYTAPGTHKTGLEDAVREKFLKEMSYTDYPTADRPLTVLPYRIEVGPHCNVTSLNYLNGYNWMTLRYFDEEGNRFMIRAAYTVQGDELELHMLQDYSYDADTRILDYTFSDMIVRYSFSFNGPAMTLSSEGKSVTLYAEDLTKEDGVDLYDANVAESSASVCGINKFNLKQNDTYIMVGDQKIVPDSYEFTEDGLFRMTWTEGEKQHAMQLVYFYADDDGLVLTDGKEYYYYNRRSWDLYTDEVSTNLDVGDAKRLENMSDAEIKALKKRVNALYTDLDQALKDAGINAKIDKETGEIALDSVLLFDVEAYAVSQEGREMLSKFLKAYTSVIFDEKYDGFVSSIEIEGHSDPTGNPDYNRTLSEYRANNVMDYCLSDAAGLDSATTERLAGMLTAQGYSSDRPIYRQDGTVDLDACRRVSFRFVITVAS